MGWLWVGPVRCGHGKANAFFHGDAQRYSNSDADKEVRAPRAFRRLKPPYPETAARAEAEATVDALVDIDARGEVGRVEIVRWAGYGLDQSVVDTVKQMHFFPAMRNSVAIPMRVLLRYNFRKPKIENSTQQKPSFERES